MKPRQLQSFRHAMGVLRVDWQAPFGQAFSGASKLGGGLYRVIQAPLKLNGR